MPAACHLFEGPTWKGADLGPNRGAFLSILHALQWAPWHLLEETKTPSGRPQESAPGVCPLAPCALRVCTAGVLVPLWSFQSQKQSRSHCPLGTDPPQVGAARASLPWGPVMQGSGGALGTHRLSAATWELFPLSHRRPPVHRGATRPGSPGVSLCCTQLNSMPNPIGRLRF